MEDAVEINREDADLSQHMRKIKFRAWDAAAVAQNDGAIWLEADKLVDRRIVFAVKSVIEFVADCAENAGHRGALSVAPATVLVPILLGICGRGV